MKYSYLLLSFVLLVNFANAQVRKRAPKKDSLTVMPCLLNDITVPPAEKQAYDLGVKADPTLEILSATDSVLKAPLDMTVASVQPAVNGGLEIVFYYQDYFFWISGVTRADAKKGQKFKKGDRFGYQALGQKIEIALYDFETPMDPKKYFTCGN